MYFHRMNMVLHGAHILLVQPPLPVNLHISSICTRSKAAITQKATVFTEYKNNTCAVFCKYDRMTTDLNHFPELSQGG